MFGDDLDDIRYCEWCGKEYSEDESDANNTEIFCGSGCEDDCLAEEEMEEDEEE